MSARAPAAPRPAPTPAAWIDKWLAACHDLAELERSNPMTDAVIDEIDGRMIRVGDRWLGFKDEEIAGFLRGAGLEHVTVRTGARLPGDPFTVLVAGGVKPGHNIH